MFSQTKLSIDRAAAPAPRSTPLAWLAPRIGVALLAVLPAVSMSAWTEVGRSDQTVFWVDDGSIVEHGPSVRDAFTSMTFLQPRSDHVERTEILNEFDCQHQLVASMRTVTRNASGKVLLAVDSRTFDFQPIKPGSGLALELAHVCAAKVGTASATAIPPEKLAAGLKEAGSKCEAELPQTVGRAGIEFTPDALASTCRCIRTSIERGDIQAEMAQANLAVSDASQIIFMRCAEPTIRAYSRRRLDESKPTLMLQRNWTDRQYDQFARCMTDVSWTLQNSSLTNHATRTPEQMTQEARAGAARCAAGVR